MHYLGWFLSNCNSANLHSCYSNSTSCEVWPIWFKFQLMNLSFNSEFHSNLLLEQQCPLHRVTYFTKACTKPILFPYVSTFMCIITDHCYWKRFRLHASRDRPLWIVSIKSQLITFGISSRSVLTSASSFSKSRFLTRTKQSDPRSFKHTELFLFTVRGKQTLQCRYDHKKSTKRLLKWF